MISTQQDLRERESSSMPPPPTFRAMLKCGVDMLACTCSFLDISAVIKLRLVSKETRSAVDCDVVWATIVRDQLSFTRLVPVGKSGGWKQLVQRMELHQPSKRLQEASLLPVDDERVGAVNAIVSTLADAGKWVTVASVPPGASTVPQFHRGCSALFDMTAGPKSLGAKQQSTCTVGVVLAGMEATSDAATLLAVQNQVLDFLQMHTNRPEDIVRALVERSTAESVASIEVFNAAPHCGREGSHRCVFVLRVTNDAQRNPAGVSKLLEALFHVCSSVQFVGPDQSAITQFCGWYGEALPMVAAAPFSTGANTPSIAFTTTAASAVDLTQLVVQNPQELNSWIFNRTSSVGTSLLGHKNLFSLAKPSHCPSWVNAAVTVAICPATVLRMIEAFLEEDGNAWSSKVMRFHGAPEEQRIRAFYENAIRTEFEHHTRPETDTAYLADIPTPMNPLLMVEAHNLYFYAAIRKYGYALPMICGRDSAGGLKLLEVLKRNVSDVFRTFWRRNNEYSRTQCHAIFDHTFGPVAARFFDIEQSPLLLDKRRGLRQWYTIIGDKIMEYDLKAKGLRKYDILSEELADRVFPQLLQFLQQANANIPTDKICTHEVDAQRAIADLRQMVIDRTAADTKVTDGTLNKSQHESALYTAAMSNELASMQSKSAVGFLQSIEEDSEAWEQACLCRIRTLTLPPKNNNNIRSGGDSSAAAAHSEQHQWTHNGNKTEMASLSTTSRMPLSTTEGGGGSSSSALDGADGQSDLTDLEDMMVFNGQDHDASAVQRSQREEDVEDELLLSRCAEGRGQVLSEALAEELDRRSQASRLSSRLDQQRSVFDVVARERISQSSSKGSAMRRVKSAWNRLWS